MTQPPSSWVNETVLLLIDVQKDFYSKTQILATFPEFKGNVTQLLKLCREKGIEVIHVRAEYNESDSLWFEWGKARGVDKIVHADYEDFSKEENNEKVVVKHTFDAFMNTDLEKYLREKNIKNVIAAGLVTSCCVLLTVFSAFLRGFKTFVVEDCCADRVVTKHTNTMEAYGAYAFFRVTKDNLIEEMGKWLIKTNSK